MHIHFIAIGGAGIGPLAQIAQKAGYSVSGSDLRSSQYIDYLKSHGINNIYIGQDEMQLAKLHKRQPIDWVVYSSAVTMVNDQPPVLQFCQDNGIKYTKRDKFINLFISDNNLKMIGVAGTHGKTTTTAMLLWLFKGLDIPVSYVLSAKVDYGEMADYDAKSDYFIYEADEFDRNFLAYKPELSLISGISYDHQEIYPTLAEYKQAFIDYIGQSSKAIVWSSDLSYLNQSIDNLLVLSETDAAIDSIKLEGLYNRFDAWLAVNAVNLKLNVPFKKSIDLINNFPGLSRRMEELVPGLYSDYAHTPEKIKAAMSVATETAKKTNQKVIVVYEPLTNRRQLYMADKYGDCFSGADKLYWLPSYLAREDPSDRVLTPEELIKQLSDPSIAQPAERDTILMEAINHHLNSGDMVVGIAGGGGDSLDDWLRQNFTD